jgi:hypothetical protein
MHKKGSSLLKILVQMEKFPNLCNAYQIQTTKCQLRGSNVCEVGLRMLELMNANRILYKTKIEAMNKEQMETVSL